MNKEEILVSLALHANDAFRDLQVSEERRLQLVYAYLIGACRTAECLDEPDLATLIMELGEKIW